MDTTVNLAEAHRQVRLLMTEYNFGDLTSYLDLILVQYNNKREPNFSVRITVFTGGANTLEQVEAPTWQLALDEMRVKLASKYPVTSFPEISNVIVPVVEPSVECPGCQSMSYDLRDHLTGGRCRIEKRSTWLSGWIGTQNEQTPVNKEEK